MAAGGQLQAGDLARNPDVGKLRAEQRRNGAIQLADGKDSPRRRPEVELQPDLLHRAMVPRLLNFFSFFSCSTAPLLDRQVGASLRCYASDFEYYQIVA